MNPNNVDPSNYEPKKTKFIWEPVGQTKIPCHFHSSSYNAKSNTIYMFGGNTVVNMGGRGHDIAKRINLLSSLRKYYVIVNDSLRLVCGNITCLVE